MTKQTGLSMTEVLTALVLIGLIAALTVPSFMTNAGVKQNITKTKNVISELHHARSIYRDGVSDPSVPPDNGSVLGGSTKYANVNYMCNAHAGVPPEWLSSTYNFAPDTDCYRYPDGSMLEADAGVLGGNIIRFNFYPNGADGKVQPVSLVMDYDADRITSWGAYDNNVAEDPDWAKDWTKF